MATVYILYSKTIDTFYIGSCKELNLRIQQHLNKEFANAYTSNVSDWEIFFEQSNLDSALARKFEVHIKKMKSRKFFERLKKYSEIFKKLMIQYSEK